MKMKVFIIILLSTIVLNCDVSESKSSSQAEINSVKLKSVLEETVNEHKVPGAIMLVKFEDGSIWKEAYGNSNIKSGNVEAMDLLNNFRIGSVTKTFIASAILILVKENKLSLTDTIETLLPGVLLHGKEIALEMVLNQSSALINYTIKDSFTEKYISQPQYDWQKEEIISLFKDEDLITHPGDSSYYSNSNYYILGSIIEKVSGQQLNQFLEEKIFTPLEMTNTYFPTTDYLRDNYSHGYFDVNYDGIFTEDEDLTNQNPNAIWAAGFIVSTVDDLLIWSDEMLNVSLLTPDLQTKRMDINIPIAGAPNDVNYGLGIANIFGAIGHTGAVSGYSTILFKYKNRTFIAFGNGYETTGEGRLIAEDLFEKAKEALFD